MLTFRHPSQIRERLQDLNYNIEEFPERKEITTVRKNTPDEPDREFRKILIMPGAGAFESYVIDEHSRKISKEITLAEINAILCSKG